MAKQNQAWLLTPLGLPPCMVALHEVMQYLTEFQPLQVPFTPAYCTTAIVWQDQVVPVLNLGIFASEIFFSDFKLVVLAYQTEPLLPLNYIALAVNQAPERITVTDDTTCDLPATHTPLWQHLAKSCVLYQNTATPIISVAMLDSVAVRNYAEQVFAELGPSLQLTWKDATAMFKAPDKTAPAILENSSNSNDKKIFDDNHDLLDMDDLDDDDDDDDFDPGEDFDDADDSGLDAAEDWDDDDFDLADDFDDLDPELDDADDWDEDISKDDDSDADLDDDLNDEDLDFDDEDLDDEDLDDEDLDDEDLDFDDEDLNWDEDDFELEDGDEDKGGEEITPAATTIQSVFSSPQSYPQYQNLH